ncbi:MAG: UDP-glucose 4-epimerase GalE, partial [Halofilum sp. (in: g-proteobacteria)]
MRILVTGGAGYIGSHTCVDLLEHGHDVVVVDNLCNGSLETIERVQQIAGRSLTFHRADIRDRRALDRVFAERPVDAVVHFAALKAVGGSSREPLSFFDNNVGGTVTLGEAMLAAGVDLMVFSSSAAVYGTPKRVPVPEDAPTGPVNPYGRSKLMSEQILRDLQTAAPGLRVALLRYFNPGGAHASGLIGEIPPAIPENLLPYIGQVAAGLRDRLRVFGGDYPTPDGTGIRDYIHIEDLARGHAAALDALEASHGPCAGGGVLTVNLGTGQGYSVLEMVRAYERASGREIPCEIVERRSGDVARCYADASRAVVRLAYHCEQVRLTISDDGCGSPEGVRRSLRAATLATPSGEH